RSDVGTAFRLAMRGEVLGSGDDVIFVNARAWSLQCFHDRHGHARSEVRIFAVSLFGATPAWLATEVQVWSQYLMTAARACLERARGKNFCDELRIPTGRKRDW